MSGRHEDSLAGRLLSWSMDFHSPCGFRSNVGLPSSEAISCNPIRYNKHSVIENANNLQPHQGDSATTVGHYAFVNPLQFASDTQRISSYMERRLSVQTGTLSSQHGRDEAAASQNIIYEPMGLENDSHSQPTHVDTPPFESSLTQRNDAEMPYIGVGPQANASELGMNPEAYDGFPETVSLHGSSAAGNCETPSTTPVLESILPEREVYQTLEPHKFTKHQKQQIHDITGLIDKTSNFFQLQQPSPISEPELPAKAIPMALDQDQAFVDQVKESLKAQSKWKTANVGRRQARRIHQLLELAQPPDSSEALFLSGDEASRYMEPNAFFPGIIVTKNQQILPLQTTKQFLDEYYDDLAKVWIQDPVVLLSRDIPHAREITVGQLKKRFLTPSTRKQIPWNCLELATHVEDGLRPAFLNTEDCRLLTKLKHPTTEDHASRRGYEPGWKEIEKWALIAQGEALTEPHQDSHGYSTYITLNQGVVGFGWLSNPTASEREAWRSGPATFTAGSWRYIILRPGQTIFFPCGTVHFVFRLHSVGDTLAFGGHVLRCSQIVSWVKCMLEEREAPAITNEDITSSAPGYLERVEKFVRQARISGNGEKWGGEAAIEEFLLLKEKFMNGTK